MSNIEERKAENNTNKYTSERKKKEKKEECRKLEDANVISIEQTKNKRE